MDQTDIISPIVAELTSEDSYSIQGKGSVYIVRNPRDTHSDERWGWLIGHWVKLDGRLVEVLGVESYLLHGRYAKGKPIGIIVREETII